MKHPLLWHVAQIALGLLCWFGFIGAMLRDAWHAFVNPASNRDRL